LIAGDFSKKASANGAVQWQNGRFLSAPGWLMYFAALPAADDSGVPENRMNVHVGLRKFEEFADLSASNVAQTSLPAAFDHGTARSGLCRPGECPMIEIALHAFGRTDP
jgi:hypothetical protein